MVPPLASNLIEHVTLSICSKLYYNRFWYLCEVIFRCTDFLCSLFEAVNLLEIEIDILSGLFLKYVNTAVQFLKFQQGVVWTSVFNKFLNNKAGVILSGLSVLYVSPEDGVRLHRNMGVLRSLLYCDWCCV